MKFNPYWNGWKDLNFLIVNFSSSKTCKITTSNIIFIKQYVLSGLILSKIDQILW